MPHTVQPPPAALAASMTPPSDYAMKSAESFEATQRQPPPTPAAEVHAAPHAATR